LDEEEMLEPRQIQLVYPQLHGRLTFSSVGKFFHLGTMQYDAPLFMENVANYPTKIHDWTQCPWLIKAGHIQRLIDDGKTPEWTIDMLYRCIPSAPNGLLFATVEEGTIQYKDEEVQYGMDFGKEDNCVGVVIRGKICYVVEEYAFQLELYPSAYDFINGRPCEAEGGGYNDSEKYGEKSLLMMQRIHASKHAVTEKWKSERQIIARQFDLIIIDKKMCPNTYTDVKGASFGPDGVYLKNTLHPCHYLDAYFHSIHIAPSLVDTNKPLERKRRPITRYI